MILLLQSLFINKYHYITFIIFCLFTLTFHGRFPVSPLIPYNIKFVQRGFTERAAFEEHTPRVGLGFSYNQLIVVLHEQIWKSFMVERDLGVP
jgi:hypothetical protein